MQDAALAANQAILDPELVVAGAGGAFTVGTLLAAPPLGVHRAGLDARDHPHVPLRRARKGGRPFPAHRVTSARNRVARVIGRIGVIHLGEHVEITGIEGLKPFAHELEGIGRHVRYLTAES